MLSRSAKISAVIFGTLLAGTLGALWLMQVTVMRSAPAVAGTIDRRLLDTARQVASIAETAQEQELAGEAARIADHELDQAFASAVREAASAHPPAGGATDKMRARVEQAQARIAAAQARIGKLPKDAADQIEVAQAQLALDQDELEDAQADLERAGGDPHAALQRAMAEHQAAENSAATARPPAPMPLGTIAQQFGAWRTLGDRESQVEAARQQALARAAGLSREHNSLEALIAQKPLPAAGDAPPQDDSSADDDTEEDPAEMVARLRNLSDQRKTLTELDRRIQDCTQLADTYQTWNGLLDTRRGGVARILLRSLALVFGLLLVAVLVETGAQRALHDTKDRHRDHQQRFLVSVAVRVTVVGAILLLVFGMPSQTSTVIGLAGAGLTVVLRDFLVAFIGWFVLMGRNGVRIGDWVEIRGVGGEVIEIGLFKTVLLEMGNWSNTGHPTGRRVSFMNSFAIEGHWFNFSTAGQWLWDELQVTIPPGLDPYATAERIREVVERQTEADAQQAERDWERITRQYGTRAFSAKPAVDLRPGASGLEVQVRYITRGPERYELKSKLFREIVELVRN
jgi:small-conductance mechanosensitive channel